MFTIGARYKVSNHPNNIFTQYPTFYGICQNFTVHEDGRFIRVQFIHLTNYFHEPIPYEKWCLLDTYNHDYICMHLMPPELAQEIHHRKIPTLANLCRTKIPFKTRIEAQGTYIADVINDVVGCA
jgi:hypothetical protein